MIIKVKQNGNEYTAYGYEFVVREVQRSYKRAYVVYRDFSNGTTAIIAEVAAGKQAKREIRREIAYYVGNQIMISAELENILWDVNHR